MNLKTISSDVKYIGRSNGEINIKKGHPIIKYPSIRNTLNSKKNNLYNDGYSWKKTYPKIIKDIKNLDKIERKEFENELKIFLSKYGPLLVKYKKQVVEKYKNPDTSIIIKEETINLIKKYIRWFNYLTILVEEVIKNTKGGGYILYKKWLNQWVYNQAKSFRNGEGPYHIHAVQAIEIKNDKKNKIDLKNYKGKPYHPRYSRSGGVWDKSNNLDLLDITNKFNFILYHVHSNKEINNHNIKIKETADNAEIYYYLAFKSALKMFKPWIEDANLELNINHLKKRIL